MNNFPNWLSSQLRGVTNSHLISSVSGADTCTNNLPPLSSSPSFPFTNASRCSIKCYQETRSLESSSGDPVTMCSYDLFITTKYDRFHWFYLPKMNSNSRKQYDNFSNAVLQIHSSRDPSIRRLDTLYSQQALMAPSISWNATSHIVFLTVSFVYYSTEPNYKWRDPCICDALNRSNERPLF